MGNFGRDDRGGRGGFGGRRSFGGNDRGGYRGGDRGGRGGFGGGRSFNRGGDDRPREMFDAVCDNCGRDCQVPFKPTSGKPVYCSDCFEKMNPRDNRESRSNDNPHFAPRGGALRGEQNKAQLDSLSEKLDKIISLLEKTQTPAEPAAKVKKASKVEKVEVI